MFDTNKICLNQTNIFLGLKKDCLLRMSSSDLARCFKEEALFNIFKQAPPVVPMEITNNW